MAGCKVHICPEIYQQWAGRGYDKTLWEDEFTSLNQY